MRIYISVLVVLIGINTAKAITIEDCYEKARNNYPLIKQHSLIEQTKGYNLSNANKGYLPQISFTAKASYQSDVAQIPISMPGVKSINKDQYSMVVDITQTIWDGGIIHSQKQITKTNSDISKAEIEVDLYTINQRVNDVYFGILLLNSKIQQNKLLQEELERNYNLILSCIENGTANKVDLDAVKVEQLKAKQTSIQLNANKVSYTEVLSELIGEAINTELETPQELAYTASEIKRPELYLFTAQYNNLEERKKLLKTDYMPKLGLFLTGGYANPGLNMLKPEFAAYYIGGLRLSWNFGSLYTQKNSKKIIDANIQSVEVSKETFLFNSNLQVNIDKREIDKQRNLLLHDDEIILLRNNVKKATEVKVQNGIMSITDLLREVTAEDLAKQDKINREIELRQAIYSLKHTRNN